MEKGSGLRGFSFWFLGFGFSFEQFPSFFLSHRGTHLQDQVHRARSNSQEHALWKCVWRGGMDIRQGPYTARKSIVGVLGQDETFQVDEERAFHQYNGGGENGKFLHLADGRGWVFNLGHSGTFCIPLAPPLDAWSSWRSPQTSRASQEGSKSWKYPASGQSQTWGQWNRGPDIEQDKEWKSQGRAWDKRSDKAYGHDSRDESWGSWGDSWEKPSDTHLAFSCTLNFLGFLI